MIILDDPRKSTSVFGPVTVIAQANTEPVRRAANRLARGAFSQGGHALPKAQWKKSALDAEKRLLRLLRATDAGLLPLYARVTLTGTAYSGATGEGSYQAAAAEILNRAAMAEIARRYEEAHGPSVNQGAEHADAPPARDPDAEADGGGKGGTAFAGRARSVDPGLPAAGA